MKKQNALAVFFILLVAAAGFSPADVPQLISFQGKLYDGQKNLLTGEYEVTFRIYDRDEGGTAFWSETKDVICEDGLYAVILGQTSPVNLDFDGQYWLGMQVTGDSELSPRYRLVSVPTAFRAQIANQVSWTNLIDLPAGFADGTDDVGAAGGVSQIEAGTGIQVANPTGPTTTIAHAADASALPNAHHTKTTDASELTSGRLSNDLFSAYSDLVTEEKIGTGNDEVAAGNHNHDDDYINETGPQEMTGDSNNPILSVINNGNGAGIRGSSNSDMGVYGSSSSGYGVYGYNTNGAGVYGYSEYDKGIHGVTDFGWAGYFTGNTYLSGKVGIGTTDPQAKLALSSNNTYADPSGFQVLGTAQRLYISADGLVGSPAKCYSAIQSEGWFLDWGPRYLLLNPRGGNVGVGTTDPGTQLHVKHSASGLTPANVSGLFVENEGSLNNFFVFQTATAGGGKSFTITNTGNVGIATTNPGYKLHVIGDIAYTGNIYDVSDIRLKENIVPLENAVEKVSAIHSIYFNNKGEPSDKREVGVIAQEVEKVLPEIVSENAEGYKSVDYSKLTPLLIEAVKELKAENERLKQRIDRLETAKE